MMNAVRKMLVNRFHSEVTDAAQSLDSGNYRDMMSHANLAHGVLVRLEMVNGNARAIGMITQREHDTYHCEVIFPMKQRLKELDERIVAMLEK